MAIVLPDSHAPVRVDMETGMPDALSLNTKAILLLTAPLDLGGRNANHALLTAGEYKRLAKLLREAGRQPADLLAPDAMALLQSCQPVVELARLQGLLARGFLLSQAVARWETRGIWVLSRADALYPARFKTHLRDDAPAILYGCGEKTLLGCGGLAVVGSRNVDDELISYSARVGNLAAQSGIVIISGGARGVDRAAMDGAMDAGGVAIGVLAENLEKCALNRDMRNRLMNHQLVLISPNDPNAGFHVSTAMQRNKLIYALADCALVVNSDLNKGGTWAGASEQLDKWHMVPLYVRATGVASDGLRALQAKGAMPWPEPESANALQALIDGRGAPAGTLPLSTAPALPDGVRIDGNQAALADMSASDHTGASLETASSQIESESADVLFATVRELIKRLLKQPMKDAEIAAALKVSNSQVKAWLARLVDEGIIEKPAKSPEYVVKQALLFE